MTHRGHVVEVHLLLKLVGLSAQAADAFSRALPLAPRVFLHAASFADLRDVRDAVLSVRLGLQGGGKGVGNDNCY